MSPEEKQILRAGLAPEILDSGCCGLAGSFGYAAEHHHTSMEIGNKILLPIIRNAPLDTLSDLGDEEMEALMGWEERFSEKYLVVGKLVPVGSEEAKNA